MRAVFISPFVTRTKDALPQFSQGFLIQLVQYHDVRDTFKHNAPKCQTIVCRAAMAQTPTTSSAEAPLDRSFTGLRSP